MTKQEKIYRIFMTSMIVIIAGLLLATGIIAVQKSMKLKVGVSITPSMLCKITDSSDNVLFCNTTKNSQSLYVTEGASISGNMLTLNKSFSNLGGEFALKIYNYTTVATSGNVIKVTASGTGVETTSMWLPSYSSGTPTAGEINVTAVAGSITLQFEEVAKPSFTVTYNLTDCTSNKTSGASVTYGTSYSATITPTTGYSLPSTITVANISTGGYSWDYLTGVFTITDWTKVNGNITITAAAMPFAIKTYNTTNVTTNYNSAWDGYSYVEFGEYPVAIATPTSPTATGEIYTYGDNTFTIYKDANGKYATINSGTDYYKFEPIRWMIIATSGELTDTTIYGNGATKHADMPAANENKKQLLLLSEFGLYRDYFDKEFTTNQFGSSNCDVQVSLNGSFAKMAGLYNYFATTVGAKETGKYIAKVQPSTRYFNDELNENSCDEGSSYNIFLLGYETDSNNKDTYHVTNYMTINGGGSKCVASVFATKTGIYYVASDNSCAWWLRTGTKHGSTNAYYMHELGNYVGTDETTQTLLTTRPAFVFNLA